MHKELQELDTLNGFFNVRMQFLKQKILIQDKDQKELEKCYVGGRDLKGKVIEKVNILEKRVLDMQVELIMHSQRTAKY